MPAASARANCPVVQVGLVHDLRDRLEAPVSEPKALEQGLECAVLALMAELGAHDIERDSLLRGICCVGEREPGLGIDEALDQPCRGDPVDVRARPRHPGAARGRHGGPASPAGRLAPRFRGGEPLRERFQAARARSPALLSK